ncbi:aminotransferase class V-fold PLP-dependent enzyme [Cytobacillus suaedae]|nr:aminotransferase class V-fold PLP-dependent enzyme [Cytobacillus suaedae]
MIPLYKPYMPPLPALNEILNSGNLSYGQNGKTFEEELGKFLGSNQIIITNTFNTAILVVLSVLDIGFGDEIITSPMACLVSTQPLASLGVKVIWADIDPNTGTLDPESVREKITSKTKAIIHNHYCGYLGYIDEINSIGKQYDIPIIDDGIEAFGSEYKGNKLGNCGSDITIFSFGAVRTPNTIDGGAIVFKDKFLYEKSKIVRDSGIDRSIFRDELGEISPKCDISLIGYNGTMSDINSYIGIQQMKHVNELITQQRSNAKKWNEELAENKDLKIIFRKDVLPNYWVFGLLAQNKRETIKLFRDNGYYASGVHINNNIYSVFGDKKQLIGVNDFYKSFVAIPSGWWFAK